MKLSFILFFSSFILNGSWLLAQYPHVYHPQDGTTCVRDVVELRLAPGSSGVPSGAIVEFYGRRKRPSSFSMTGIPDTQYYTSHSFGGTPEQFYAQMEWIRANRDSANIRYVAHLGDCVEHGGLQGNEAEWTHVDSAFAILEHPGSGPFRQGVPYGICVGNHDQDLWAMAAGPSTMFNKYFGENRFADRAYYGGHMGTDNDNHFTIFSSEDYDFLGIHIEYDESGDTERVLWADSLMKAHPDRIAFLFSHYLMNADGTFSKLGRLMFEELQDNPNFFMMMCGHVPGERLRTDTLPDGRMIHTLLADFQNRPRGGDGWLRHLSFDPIRKKVGIRTYSPTLNQHEHDGNSEFNLPFNFEHPFRKLASVQFDSANEEATYTWSALIPNTDYEWYSRVVTPYEIEQSEVHRFSTQTGFAIRVDTMMCEGDALLLDPGGGFSNYIWSTGSHKQKLVVQQPGTYRLLAKDFDGCEMQGEWNVRGKSRPAAPSFEITGNWICAVGANEELQWSLNGAKITTSSSSDCILAEAPGTYRLTVQPAECLSAAAEVQISSKTVPVGSEVKIFPNPNMGNFTISSVQSPESIQEIRILDLQGKTLYQERARENAPMSGSFQVNCTDLPAGSYLLWVRIGAEVHISQLQIL